MLQVKVFKEAEAEELNKFITTVELSGNIHIRNDGAFVVFYYPPCIGIDKDAVRDILSKELAKMQAKRVECELELRYWTGKQMIPNKQNEKESAVHRASLEKAKGDIEETDTQIRGVKQMIKELESGEFTL